MAELEFKRVELSDREKARELLDKSGFRGCEYTFGNNFVWRNFYNNEICFADGFYFIKNGSGRRTRFVYPAGGGDMKNAIGLLEEYCAEQNVPLTMYANKEITQKLTEMYPNAKAVYNRDISDYLYLE